jgi:hypothetical protein
LRDPAYRGAALAALAALLPLTRVLPQQLTATELGVGVASSIARRTFLGAELGAAHRPSGESRIALALAGGHVFPTDGYAARAQLTLQLLVNASARSGIGIYAGTGAAFLARSDAPSRSYLAVVIGVEQSPGRRGGAFVELGLAGGVRAAVGLRRRWFPRWWRGA